MRLRCPCGFEVEDASPSDGMEVFEQHEDMLMHRQHVYNRAPEDSPEKFVQPEQTMIANVYDEEVALCDRLAAALRNCSGIDASDADVRDDAIDAYRAARGIVVW